LAVLRPVARVKIAGVPLGGTLMRTRVRHPCEFFTGMAYLDL